MKLDNEALKCHKQLRVYDFPIDLYSKHVSIYVGKTIKEAAAGAMFEYKGLDLSDIKEGAGGYAIRATNKGLMANIILISIDAAKTDNLLVICAHESVHISWDILYGVGVHLEAENHEAQAYLVDHIFGACKYAIEHYIKTYKLKIKL